MLRLRIQSRHLLSRFSTQRSRRKPKENRKSKWVLGIFPYLRVPRSGSGACFALNVFGSGLSGLRSLGLVAIVLGFSACAREPLHQTQAYVFGTLVEVAIYGETEARAAAITA